MTLEELQKRTPTKEVFQSEVCPNVFHTYGDGNLTEIIKRLALGDLVGQETDCPMCVNK